MMVVARAIVGLAAIGSRFKLFSKRGSPSLHVKCPCADSRTASANACACQGSANAGPPSSRGKLGRNAKPSGCGTDSGWFKIVIPQIKVDRILWCRLFSP